MLLFTSSFSLCLSLLLTSSITICRGCLLSSTRLFISVLLNGVVVSTTLLALRAELQGLRDLRDTDLVGHAPLLFLDDLGPDCDQLEYCGATSVRWFKPPRF